MGGDPQYMWGQARSGQPAGRIGHWRSARAGAPLFAGTGAGAAPVPNPASRLAGSGLPPHILGVTPHILGVFLLIIIIINYYYLLWGVFSYYGGSQNSRDVIFQKKKAPARQPRVVVGIGFHRRSQIQRILTKIIPLSEKVREAK